MESIRGGENTVGQGGMKAALEETEKWIGRQIEHVWRALGAADKGQDRKLEIKENGKRLEYGFIYKGKLLARARSYFSHTERQWKFELMQVDREYYSAVKQYFAGRA